MIRKRLNDLTVIMTWYGQENHLDTYPLHAGFMLLFPMGQVISFPHDF